MASSYRLLSPQCHQGLLLKVRPAYSHQDMTELVSAVYTSHCIAW